MYALASAKEDVSGAPADRHSGVPATECFDIPAVCVLHAAWHRAARFSEYQLPQMKQFIYFIDILTKFDSYC